MRGSFFQGARFCSTLPEMVEDCTPSSEQSRSRKVDGKSVGTVIAVIADTQLHIYINIETISLWSIREVASGYHSQLTSSLLDIVDISEEDTTFQSPVFSLSIRTRSFATAHEDVGKEEYLILPGVFCFRTAVATKRASRHRDLRLKKRLAERAQAMSLPVLHAGNKRLDECLLLVV